MAAIDDFPVALFEEHSDFPQYVYGMWLAVNEAARLGNSEIGVLELGVAGGNGLVAMERIASALEILTSVRLRIAGFDLGTGMPRPADYRDLPHLWREGFFTMDEARLRGALSRSDLYIGDIQETAADYIKSLSMPVGFISWDLDYYSSTKSAMSALLGGGHECYLPRTVCYFDDTVGPHFEMHSRWLGELRAIEEFNSGETVRKLDRIHGLAAKFNYRVESWVEGIYVLHDFGHPRYADYIYPEADRQFPLVRRRDS